MPQRRRILPTLAVAVIFIVLEVAALRFMRSDGIMQDFFLARISHVFKAKVWGGTQRIGDYFALRGANDRLAEENFRLAQQVRSLRKILPHIGIGLVHCALAGDKGHNAARSDFIQSFGEEIVVDQKIVFVIPFIQNLKVAERDIAD